MKELILETPIEVAIGAVLIGALAGGFSYAHESAKQGQIPLGFSEISHIKLQQTLRDTTVPPLTQFYAAANDTVMQVFEANNISYNVWGGDDERFAYELEKKVDPSMRVHKLVSDYAKLMPSYADVALGSLKKLDDANKDLPAVIKALDKAWHDSHYDVTHTEYDEYTTCDSEGQNCTTTVTSREVYDYTIHTYKYDQEQGELAARLLQGFVAKHPDLSIREQLLVANQTNAENEWAMRESRRHLPDYKHLKQDDYVNFSRVWASGSNYAVLQPEIEKGHAGLVKDAPLWSVAKGKATYHRYITYRHSDDGPEEFQVAEKALAHATDVSKNIKTMTGGIRYAAKEIPALSDKIQNFVNIELHNAEGDSNGMRKEILRDARAVYAKNYAEGFDTYPSNWLATFCLTLLGMMVGGGVGLGADRYINYKAYERGARKQWPPRYRNI